MPVSFEPCRIIHSPPSTTSTARCSSSSPRRPDDQPAPGRRVGVAPSTALARLRSLRQRGVIRGFHAEVDLAALGRPLQALIAVRLTVHAREQIDAFTAAVRRCPAC